MTAEWIRTHFLIFMLVAGTAFSYAWMVKYQKAFRLKWYTAVPAAVLLTIWGVFCVKVFAIAEAGFNLKAAGNMSLFGGVFFMPVYYFFLAKAVRVNPKVMFDNGTICMIFTLMCARVNCIFAGCCIGWNIAGTHFRWPTREAEIVFYILLMIWIIHSLRRIEDGKQPQGIIYPLYMMLYGIFRFICEFFRYNNNGRLFHLAHIWAAVSFCIGFSVYTQIKQEGKQKA